MDPAAAEAAVADLLTALAQDLDDVHLRDTPARARLQLRRQRFAALLPGALSLGDEPPRGR